MARRFNTINPDIKDFIKQQKLFFVGTAADQGRVNISPKGGDTIRVVDDNKVIWLNLTGSGNETAAHLLKNNRITLMFCAFEGKPLILRLYGTAKIYHHRDPQYHDYINLFPELPGSRQVIDINVDLVQTSCGQAVPIMDFKEERTILNTWAEKMGNEKIARYWEEKNSSSIDGYPTNILDE